MNAEDRASVDLSRWGLPAPRAPLEVIRAYALTDLVVDTEYARPQGDAWLVAREAEEEAFVQRLFRNARSRTFTEEGGESWATSFLDAFTFPFRAGRSIRLFEVYDPGRDNCVLVYRAKLKAEDLRGRSSLEMWCRWPGGREFFSRAAGFGHVVSGTTGWVTQETPFLLQKGYRPDQVRLNLAVEGAGRVWVKDVELLWAPLPGHDSGEVVPAAAPEGRGDELAPGER
jgi:hypothetical protein